MSLIISFRAVDYFFAHTTGLLFTPGYLFFFYLVTHAPTLQGFYADAHRLTLKCWWSVGGVGVGGTNQPTHHPTHPANHLPTNSYPSTHTHPATMQGFYADVHRLTMEAIPRLLLEHSTNIRTTDVAASCSSELDQLGVCHAPHSHDYFIFGQSCMTRVICTDK